MRIWHHAIIPHLCRQHLLAVWREGLGTWSIITQGKNGYSRHPAVLEWVGDELGLYMRLCVIRGEMLRRGYRPKAIPVTQEEFLRLAGVRGQEWQSLDKQIEVLRAKKCACKIDDIKY